MRGNRSRKRWATVEYSSNNDREMAAAYCRRAKPAKARRAVLRGQKMAEMMTFVSKTTGIIAALSGRADRHEPRR